ncbi:DUF2291 family protein [Amaricoccus sp. W119]|uniref:DUF2291 family protein n=1 Tax=Amaricoccus sp. W119 TaxID=3391833 RepID=UPI0039A71BAC
MRILLACAVAAALPSCKIVAKTDTADGAAQDFATVIAGTVAEDWDTRILPRLRETGAPAEAVLPEVAADFAAASGQYDAGGQTEGAPSTFVVRGTGDVVGANLESRAARLEIDVNGDGGADAELQLGPVIRGTALRDALPFYVFTDFRDQIEFAKLGRALNDHAHGVLPPPPTDPVGQTVAFLGVFAMARAGDPIQIVPVELSWGAP